MWTAFLTLILREIPTFLSWWEGYQARKVTRARAAAAADDDATQRRLNENVQRALAAKNAAANAIPDADRNPQP